MWTRTRILLLGTGLACAIASAASADDGLLERGNYLVNTIMACGNCHTPMTPQGPDVSRALSGGLRFNEPVFDVYASNITPDVETGIGAWSDEDIKNALVHGERPDGTTLAPIMPSAFYRALSERDLNAVVAYLRSVPAVANEVPGPTYKVTLPPMVIPGAEDPIEENERAGDPVREGFYLATIGHCMECHTGRVDHVPDHVNALGAGGFEFPGPWGVSVAANITQHPTEGIGDYSDEEIVAAIIKGVRPDGSPLMPPMGYPYYANMTDEDLSNLVAYLRTVPPHP